MLFNVLFGLLSLMPLPAQWLLLISMDQPARSLTADRLGFFYVVDERNALVKLDSTGAEMFRYQRAGTAPFAPDASDPLKPILHYPRTGHVVFLDNTLTAIGQLELQPHGYYEGTAVCRSSDDRLWVFDPGTGRLQKIEFDGTLFREGADLVQHTGFVPDVIFMREHNHKVYLCDSSRGILVTDAFGNYEALLPFKGLNHFQFVNDRLVFHSQTAMLFYDPRSAFIDSVSLADAAPFRQAVYTQNRLLTLHKNGLSLYRRKSP